MIRTTLAIAFLTLLSFSCKDSGLKPIDSQEKMTQNTNAPTEKQIQGGQEGMRQIQRTEVKKVTVEEAMKLASEGYVYIDVRTPGEIEKGKIEGAMELDVQHYNAITDASSLDPNGKYIIYCEAGNRSALLGKLLSEMQFPNVVDMTGGYSAWKEYHNIK